MEPRGDWFEEGGEKGGWRLGLLIATRDLGKESISKKGKGSKRGWSLSVPFLWSNEEGRRNRQAKGFDDGQFWPKRRPLPPKRHLLFKGKSAVREKS